MKSGTSWGKLLLRFWRQQIWVFALGCVSAFLAWPVMLLAQLSNWSETLNVQTLRRPLAAELQIRLANALGRGGQGLLIAAAAMTVAVLAAWSGFAALHAREKTDLLHSLPIRREKLFCLKALAALADLAVPAVLGCLATLAIAGARGLLCSDVWQAALRQVLVSVIYGMMTWAVSALAMLLTGQLLVGAMGTAVLLGIGPLLSGLCYLYAGSFYDTFHPMVRLTRGALWRSTSPALAALYAAAESPRFLPAAAAAALLIALALFVYKRRPSEAAGRAMAFPAAAEAIAAVLCVTGAMACGLFFRQVGTRGSDAWFAFGLAFGLLTVWAAVRMIYSMDPRRVFSHGPTLALAAVLTLGLAGYFRFDLSGFDAKLPPKDRIEDIAVVPGMEYADHGTFVTWQSRVQTMRLGCDDELYAFLGRMTAMHEQGRDGGASLPDNGAESAVITPVTVRVRLKDGKEYTRSYRMRFPDIAEDAAALYAREEYLDALYPVRVVPEEDVRELSVVSGLKGPYGLEPRERREDIRRIVRALAEDSRELTPEQVKTGRPVAVVGAGMDLSALGLSSIVQSYEDEEGNPYRFRWTEGMVVWPGFTRTIRALRQAGIETGAAPDAERIRQIDLYGYDPDPEAEAFPASGTVADRAEIAALAPRLQYPALQTHWMSVKPNVNAVAQMIGADGTVEYESFNILEEN